MYHELNVLFIVKLKILDYKILLQLTEIINNNFMFINRWSHIRLKEEFPPPVITNSFQFGVGMSISQIYIKLDSRLLSIIEVWQPYAV
jgi:hypothetical protein